jgi:hypothetical protein
MNLNFKHNKIKKCKICLIPENYPDIFFNRTGICNLCLKKSSKDNKKVKDKKEKFEDCIKKYRGKSKYDCILLFSGGKDSTYLLNILKFKYKLNILALTVDMGLLSTSTIRNISYITKKAEVDSINFRPKKSFLKKFYKYYIRNIKNTHCYSVCSMCHLIINSIGLKIAAEKKIPIVFSGTTDYQKENYELSKKILKKNWIPNEINFKPFKKEDQNYFWNPNNTNFIPRFIRPLIAIGHPSDENIIKELKNLKLGSKRSFNPIISNCSLMWLLIYLDIKKFGYHPYLWHISKQIRDGYIKRFKWFFIINIGTWLLKYKMVKRKEINLTLEFLGIKLSDLI